MVPSRTGPLMNYLDQKVYVQTSGHDWGYRNSDGVYRFEVRSGDNWAGDGAAKERSELATTKTFAFDQTYDISFQMMIEPGAKNTADWMTLMQIQSNFDKGEAGHSPAFAIEMVGDRMRIVTRDSSAFLSTPDNTTYTRHYTDTADIQRGAWYDFKISIKLDPFGGGSLDVWRNGVLLSHYEGALGFNDAVGPYLKVGVYRESSPETFAADFRNVEVTKAVENAAAPVITSDGGKASAAISMLENQTAVTKVQAVDADGTSPSYSIAGGVDAALFRIDGKTGQLSFIKAPDYEAPADSGHDNVYNVVVRASDGVHNTDQALAISVGNVNDNAPVFVGGDAGIGSAGATQAKAAASSSTTTAATTVTIAENTRFVATMHATDADGTDPVYSIAGGADAKLFRIDAHTGELSFISAPDYEAPKDANGKNLYQVVVRASDGTYNTDNAVSVRVSDVSELDSPKAGTVSTHQLFSQHFDASWKVTSSQSGYSVTRSDGQKTTVESYGADGKLKSAAVVSLVDGKNVVEQYDGNWKFTGADVTTFGEKTVVEHFDKAWKFTAADVFRMDSGKAVEEHYNAKWIFTGADVGTDKGAISTIEHYDASWRLTGADSVHDAVNGKVTIEHFNAKWSLLSADAIDLPDFHVVAADPMAHWLFA